MTQIPILLLAAGESRRMGGADKLMQDIDGITLLRRSALAALKVGPVIVALPPAPHPRYGALKGLEVQKIAIPDASEGMNASLRGALAHVPATAHAVMILLADLPDLTGTDLRAVLDTVTGHPDNLIWRGATQDGRPGHPVIFHHRLFDELKHLTGDQGAQTVVHAHTDRMHLHMLPGHHALLDLDTPEDWRAWRENRTA